MVRLSGENAAKTNYIWDLFGENAAKTNYLWDLLQQNIWEGGKGKTMTEKDKWFSWNLQIDDQIIAHAIWGEQDKSRKPQD